MSAEASKSKMAGPSPGQIARATKAATGGEAARMQAPVAKGPGPATVHRVASDAPATARAKDGGRVQRTAGNQALARMAVDSPVARVAGAPREVSHPSDATERDASRVARAVAAGGTARPEVTGAPVRGPVARAPGEAGVADRPALAPQAAAAVRNPDAGAPLPGHTRERLERGMDTDLGHVRVHRGGEAETAARSIDARAFTHGSDVWLGARESPDDLDLMAHEAAHVVQHDGAAGRVHRATTPPGGSTGPPKKPDKPEVKDVEVEPPATPNAEAGVLDAAGSTVVFPSIAVPAHKAPKYLAAVGKYGPLRRTKRYQRGSVTPVGVWRTAVGTRPAHVTALRKALGEGAVPEGAVIALSTPYAPRQRADADAGQPKADRQYYAGTLDSIAGRMRIPTWTKTGAPAAFDVDHVVELQLAGWDGQGKPGWANKADDNMELLEESANRSSGGTIRAGIETRAKTFASRVTVKGTGKPPSAEELLASYAMEFSTATTGAGGEEPSWSFKDIADGKHISEPPAGTIRLVLPEELGEEGVVTIFPPVGPRALELPAGGSAGTTLPPTVIESAKFATGAADSSPLGSITFTTQKQKDGVWKPRTRTVKVTRLTGQTHAGVLSGAAAKDLLGGTSPTAEDGLLAASPLSPVEVDLVTFDPVVGWIVEGRIVPSLSLLKDPSLDFSLRGNRLTLSKTFSVEGIKAPAPFSVTSCDLTVSWTSGEGAGGLKLEGGVGFAIDKVGKGRIGGSGKASGAFELTGSFDVASELFQPASVEMAYRKEPDAENGTFSVKGDLGIPEGKVKGIRTARATVSYADGKLAAKGTVEPSIAGIEKGTLGLEYSEKEGLLVSGALTLKKIPGIKSGSLEATVKQRPDGPGFAVSAKGMAEPSVPGLSDARIALSYEDGAFTAEATAAFARGMVKGEVTLGLSNRKPDEDGKLTGPAGPDLIPYGSGSATLALAPWLQGTVRLRLLPNGELEVGGKVELPNALTIFDKKDLSKPLIPPIGVDIPIVGVAVAGQRIGIFARIEGGVDLNAFVGPGQIAGAAISVSYNPAHEDQTHVWGGARLTVPTFAGVRLAVTAKLGAGIPLVSATLGLQIGGELGIRSGLDAGVDVDWTPRKGLVIDAMAEVAAEPVFVFDVAGKAEVTAGAFGMTLDLYSKTWQLARFEYGSGLRLGVKFPIHYDEAKGLDISLDKLTITAPEIKPRELIGGLVEKIA